MEEYTTREDGMSYALHGGEKSRVAMLKYVSDDPKRPVLVLTGADVITARLITERTRDVVSY